MAKRFTSPEEVTRYLESIPKFSQIGLKAANISLGNMQAFCERLGNPERGFKCIHVAGTNGKGTTCQMLASIYQKAGYKTGIYTSPHLIEFRERIRINGEMISGESMLSFFNLYEQVITDLKLTYFEISTALAFWYLNRERVDIAIIETGLGGRLDATNVVNPLASVITSVSYDHMDVLGPSLKEIAIEKAGIIKPDRPVVTGRLPDEAANAVAEVARKRGAELITTRVSDVTIGKDFFDLTSEGNNITIPRGQRKAIDGINIAVCWSVVTRLAGVLPVTVDEFISGISTVDLLFPHHAHFQKLKKNLNWFFDGAHNVEAIDSLLEELDSREFGGSGTLFLSMMKDKATPENLLKFKRFRSVYYIDMQTERSADCEQIRSILKFSDCYSQDDGEVLEKLDQLKSELVIFAGSFYFYSQVKKWMVSLTLSED